MKKKGVYVNAMVRLEEVCGHVPQRECCCCCCFWLAALLRTVSPEDAEELAARESAAACSAEVTGPMGAVMGADCLESARP